MGQKQSELTVVTKAKDLCSYIMAVTQKSPKHFRYTFVSRMQNLALSVIENLFRANDVFATKADKLKYFQKAYQGGNIELEEIKQTLSSYGAHLSHGHTYKLQKEVLSEFVLKKDEN